MATTRRRPFNPLNHRQLCPLHNLTACVSCHEVEGECDAGGCLGEATRTFHRLSGGRVIEVRRFCETCSTHPAFGWLRAGMTEAT